MVKFKKGDVLMALGNVKTYVYIGPYENSDNPEYDCTVICENGRIGYTLENRLWFKFGRHVLTEMMR